VLDALKILKPETVIRWHRSGFRAYWRWKSRARGGRPKTSLEIWGAPRIHGELLMLGIDIGQTTVAKYMVRSGRGLAVEVIQIGIRTAPRRVIRRDEAAGALFCPDERQFFDAIRRQIVATSEVDADQPDSVEMGMRSVTC
jgi:hypothetical protein